jgi:hypothetical protein
MGQEEENRKPEAIRQEEAKKRTEQEEKARRLEQRRLKRQQMKATKAEPFGNGQQNGMALFSSLANDYEEI